jgi:hypothetical protein
MKTATRPGSSENSAETSRSKSGAYSVRPANDDLAPLIERLRGPGLVALGIAAIACCLLISLAAQG